jgi:hypothetical protein
MWDAVRRLWCSTAHTTRTVSVRPEQFVEMARNRIEADPRMHLVGAVAHLGELSVVVRVRGRSVDVTMTAQNDRGRTEVQVYAAARGALGDFGACAAAIRLVWDAVDRSMHAGVTGIDGV